MCWCYGKNKDDAQIQPPQPHFDQTSLATYNDQQKSVIVEGLVVGEPDARDAYANLRVEAAGCCRTCMTNSSALASNLFFASSVAIPPRASILHVTAL